MTTQHGTGSYLGFDPGGRDNFGWAVLTISDEGHPVELHTGVANHAAEAVEATARASRNHAPLAVGIDSPLFWCPSSERQADLAVRHLLKTKGVHPSTVIHVNSLRGACLVQGACTARLVSTRWPSALLTEAHPKALMATAPEVQAILARAELTGKTDHERDAALAAYAAWAGFTKKEGWSDLRQLELKAAVMVPGSYRAKYWYPTDLVDLSTALADESGRRNRGGRTSVPARGLRNPIGN